jgi:hypothetical protein
MIAQPLRLCAAPALAAGLAACLLAAPAGTQPPADATRGPAAGKGYSIHIAVSKVDPAAYGGVIIDELPATLRDLAEMKKVAVKQGFTVLAELIDANATHDKVLAAIKGAQGKVKKGDTLLITYAGHGSQVPDTNGDEEDGLDETWCLYDGHLIDDELVGLWAGFEAGARIVVVLDSCHSSTAVRGLASEIMAYANEVKKVTSGTNKGSPLEKFSSVFTKARKVTSTSDPEKEAPTRGSKTSMACRAEVFLKRSARTATALASHRKQCAALKEQKCRSRLLPANAALESYVAKEEVYKKRQADLKDLPELFDTNKLKAPVISLAACQDDQTALEGVFGGFFTRALVKVWDQGRYSKPYSEFLVDIASIVKRQALKVKDAKGQPHQQDPSYHRYGAFDEPFEKIAPFCLK